ncbi:unnamed protein product, partial [Brassica oleracea var. botrytis]
PIKHAERPSIVAPRRSLPTLSWCLAPSKREQLELVALAGRSGWSLWLGATLVGRSEGSLQDARLWCLRTRGRERPWCVAPTSRS